MGPLCVGGGGLAVGVCLLSQLFDSDLLPAGARDLSSELQAPRQAGEGSSLR